jgi:hypothetical protein
MDASGRERWQERRLAQRHSRLCIQELAEIWSKPVRKQKTESPGNITGLADCPAAATIFELLATKALTGRIIRYKQG